MDKLQSRIDNLKKHIDVVKTEAHAQESQLIDSSELTAKQVCDLSKQLSGSISSLSQLYNLLHAYESKLPKVETVPSIIIP